MAAQVLIDSTVLTAYSQALSTIFPELLLTIFHTSNYFSASLFFFNFSSI